jgi:hypothetical protein
MMNAALRAFVRERAGRRCEYCRLHEGVNGGLIGRFCQILLGCKFAF